ncbi:MAG: R3H domain-containing nucleic acid-binding protein [Bacilli bacterium]
MRIFEAKNLDEVLKLASEDLGIQVEDLIYDVLEEKKGLFKSSIKVSVYETTDYIDYAVNYLKTVVEALGFTPEFKTELDGDVIKIEMSTNHNSILIGKNGRTLLALNEIVLVALTAKFKKRIRVLLDINEYKVDRYRKVVSIAKRVAGEVAKTKQDATLEPMPSDERRAIHNALSEYRNVTTESTGTGRERQIVIRYRKVEKTNK